MGGERDGRRGQLFPPSRDQGVPAAAEIGPSFYPSSTSYGSTGTSEVAPFVAHDKGTTKRKRQRHQLPGEESSLLRRSLASVGVLALFAFAVTTANNRRLDIQQLRATGAPTSFIQVSSTVSSSTSLLCDRMTRRSISL